MKPEMVSLPKEPTYAMLMALCGEPVILAASMEQAAREAYQTMIEAYTNDAGKPTPSPAP